MARIQQITGGRSNRILLGLALAAGAVAALLVFIALSNSDDGGGTVAGGSTDAVVASQDINAGTLITSDMVTLQPVDSLISGAATDTETVVGEAAVVKILAGEQVATSRIGVKNETEGAGGVLPAGMRGFSVGVDEVRAAGGLLLPGDSVDVWISGINENDPTTDDDDVTVSELLLQDIEVLAVAQTAQDVPGAQTNSSDTTTTSGDVPDDVDEHPDANSVTLIVTSEEAGILVCAQEGENKDHIWLALRPVVDEGVPADQRTQFDICNQQF